MSFLKIFDKTISIVEKNAKHIDKYSDDVILKKITSCHDNIITAYPRKRTLLFSYNTYLTLGTRTLYFGAFFIEVTYCGGQNVDKTIKRKTPTADYQRIGV